MESERFDVVIVGGGPAGCVLAARLSEDPGRRVLLLEAGPDYGVDPEQWPAELRDPLGIQPDSHSWGYVDARAAEAPALALPRARIVGGSSTVNGCIWLRGSRADYDSWEALGNPGWGFAELLPCFRAAESDPLGPSALHGSHGPVPVYRTPAADLSPIDRAFVAAAQALGFARVDDLNGAEGQTPAVGPTPKNVAAGVRMNAAFTYLAMARERPNLRLVTDVLVDRVLVEGRQAVGVLGADGRGFRGREIVLCAGAYGSPAVLLRSGIGPVPHLRDLGVPLVADLPGVGEHLLDHPLVTGLMECTVAPDRAPATTSFNPVIIKARSRQVPDEIDLHIYEGQSFDAGLGGWTFWLSLSLQDARSRGRVRLTSRDPEALLQIDHAHLTDPRDLEALCDGVELVNRLVGTQPLAGAVTPLPERTLRWCDRDELRRLVRRQVGTTYHPSSTCRMGLTTDPTAVVDHAGRVRGLAGLRVADASIFPAGPRCNLHFPTVAVAEKLAAVIGRDSRS
jgi:choline dehydrogenase